MGNHYQPKASGRTWSWRKAGIAMLALLGASFLNTSQAQVSSYTFAASSGTYTPITGGNVLGTPTNDDVIFSGLPIGFSFCFNGATYTTFGVNSNGWIYMGSSVGASSYTSLSTGSTNNVIAGFNFDLQGEPTTGELSYLTTGVSPNRTLVVQFSNYDAWSSTTNTDTYNFQIRLSESNGNIDVVYGSMVPNALRFAQVGLRGATNADFNNLSISNGITTWNAPGAGIANSSTCEHAAGLSPVSGQTFTWSLPTAPAIPVNATFTGVTSTGMTLNWDDASTNEANFIVQRSIDNITFTTVATIPSSSIPTTGTSYNYVATGLYNATLYYWRVLSANANCGGGFLAAQQSTLPGTMCGTYTVGPTGAYTSLTAAFAAVATNGVNCPLVFDLQAAYVSTVETFPINVPFLGNGPSQTITVRPETGATNLSVTSNATQTLNMNGAQYIIFDGRPGSTGTVSHLTIENTSVSGNAIQYINDASFNTLNYIKVRGVNTSASSGVIYFGAALAGGMGNSNNTFTNNELYDSGTQPANLVYGFNSTANIFNTNNAFTNNLFHDWFSAAAVNSAITLSTGNTAWAFSGNSFYQTTSRTYTTANTNFIINITTGSGSATGAFNVSGNYFGGTAALCGGTAYTTLGAVAHRFIALQTNTGTGGTNTIQGNTFRNFNFTTTSGTTTTNGIWCAINTIGTNASNNIGTVTPNVIGSTTTNGQIVTSTSGTGGLTIAYNNSASGAQNFSNNQIGGITANSSSGTVSSSIVGIQTSSGTSNTITGNTIGSLTQTSSLMNAASTGGTGGQVSGIVCSAFNSALPGNTIANNTIMNLTNRYAGTSTTGMVRGIVTTSGIVTITGNTIANLTNTSPQTGVTTASSVIGISQTSTSTGANHTISLNTISNLANLSLTGNVNVNAIIASGSTAQTTFVHRNSIIGIGAASSGTGVVLNGINLTGGICRVYNNFVNIGVDATGASLTLSHEFNGINKNNANRATVSFNTVNIGGTGVGAGAANSNAFRRISNPTATPVDSVYSNIFNNVRSNGASTGTHYAININNTTNIISNGNNLYGNGTGYATGIIGVTPAATFTAWQSASAQDANSYGIAPAFISATNLHISNLSQSHLESRAVPVAGINTDIDNDNRPGPTGSVNGGGTIADIGADEFDGIPILVDAGALALLTPLTTGCHTSCDAVRVRIRNNATAALNMATNNVTITGTVTGPNPTSFGPLVITSGIIPAGGTLDTTIMACYNMSAVGTYVFNFSASAGGMDVITSNDAMAPVSINISAGTIVVTPDPNCVGSNTTLSVSGQTTNATLQWQSSPDNITWTNIPGATTSPFVTNPTDTTFYRVIGCGLHTSASDTVHTIFVAPPTTTHDTICGIGSVTLGAAGSGTLAWFTAPTGGLPVFTGTSYTTSITSTTTWYVENQFQSFGSSSTPATPTCYPVYTSACSSADIINNFSTTGGITNISNLGSGCNGALPSNTTFFPTQIHTTTPGSTVNFTVQSGSSWSQGFRLWVDFNNDGDFTDVGEDVWNSVTSSTAPYNGSFLVPVGAAPGPKRMRMMCRFVTVPTSNNDCSPPAPNNSFGEVEEYTLLIGVLCSSTRVPATGTVTPPPTITVSNVPSVCDSALVPLTVTSPNTGYVYTWASNPTLDTLGGDSVNAALSLATGQQTYIVNALDGTTGCFIADTMTIGVNPTPVIAATVVFDTLCAGAADTLNVAPAFANPVIVGTPNVTPNTNTGYPAPYGNFYWGSRHQMLITAAELTASGLTAGYINALSFELTASGTNGTQPLDNLEIKMAMTNITSVTTIQTMPMTSVFFTPSYTPVNLVNTHNFTAPFYWDGVSNLLIETCHNNSSFIANCSFRQTSTTYESTVYYRADAPGVCSNTSVTGFAFQRPIMRFHRSAGWDYSWTPGAGLSDSTVASPTFNPTVTTTYYVTATDTVTGCTKMDSVIVYVNPLPPVDLRDTVICSAGMPFTAMAPVGGYSYLWHDSTTTASYIISANDSVAVTVTDTVTGCWAMDSMMLAVTPSPTFTLANDTAICNNNAPFIAVPSISGNYAYLWSDSSTNDSLAITTSGNYWLTVTDTSNGCAEVDSIMIAVNPNPVFTLGNDSTLCSNNAPVVLNGPSGTNNYLWSDNSTGSSLSVSATGSVNLTVTDSVTGCAWMDTVMITINPTPTFTLGADDTICSNSSLALTSGLTGGYDYLWSDASTNDSLWVSTSGSYGLTVTDTVTGCAFSDTISLSLNPSPVFTLGNDSSICGSGLVVIAPAGGYNYLWNDGSTGNSYNATSSDSIVWLTVTDSISGCGATDSVTLNINPLPVVSFELADDTVCVDDGAFAINGSPSGGTFSGSTGIIGNTFSPTAAGVGTHYITYTYTDGNGCVATSTDTIWVNACVGFNELNLSGDVNVFPNPNDGAFTLNINNADFLEMSIQIINMEGKVIYSDMLSNVTGTYTKRFDLAEFANGVYYVRITTEKATSVKRIIKNK